MENIQELIKVNYIEDSELNKKYLENEYRVACTRSPIEKGTKIIDRGEIVTAQKALEIKEAERIINNEEESKNSYPIIGFIIIVFIIFALMFIYISVYRRNSILDDKRKLIFVVFLLGIITIFAYSTMQRYTFGPYVVPVTLVPVIIVTFFDSRTAFFLSVMQVLLCGHSAIATHQLHHPPYYPVHCGNLYVARAHQALATHTHCNLRISRLFSDLRCITNNQKRWNGRT